jgi:hypothetical protein
LITVENSYMLSEARERQPVLVTRHMLRGTTHLCC